MSEQFRSLVQKAAAWNPALHPRTPKGQPGGGRFASGNGKKRGKQRKELPDWLWDQMTAASVGGFTAILGDPDVASSQVSLPKRVKRTRKGGKEYQVWWTINYQTRDGQARSFQAKAIIRPKGIDFPESGWGGKPEWRPGYTYNQSDDT